MRCERHGTPIGKHLANILQIKSCIRSFNLCSRNKLKTLLEEERNTWNNSTDTWNPIETEPPHVNCMKKAEVVSFEGIDVKLNYIEIMSNILSTHD